MPKFGIECKNTFLEHHIDAKVEAEKLVFPLFTNYKMISLD